MNGLEILLHADAPALRSRWFGVYPALVSDIRDPESLGRVKVTLPWSPDNGGERYEVWARLATLMGGRQRGSWLIPDVGDEVLVVFEAGDARRPYIIGGLWNGADAPPETMDGAGNNFKKVLKSRNGVTITLDDQNGQEQFIAETPGGQKLTLKDGPGSIEIADSNGNSLRMEASGITINTSAVITLNASSLTVSASAVSVNAGSSNFSGTVIAATVNTPSVVAATYTPGAGNIW
jgi:uncharacterized protein involved in type VI secretion and phage assembly